MIYCSQSLSKQVFSFVCSVYLLYYSSLNCLALEGLIKETTVNGEKGTISIDWGTGMARQAGSHIEIYRQDLEGNTTWVGYGFVRGSDLSLADTFDTFDGLPLQIGDAVRVQQQSKICSRIGQTVYVIASPDLTKKIQADQVIERLFVYRVNRIPRFLKNRWYTFDWQEKVCDLTKPKLVQRSKIKSSVVYETPAKGDWVYSEDLQSQNRYDAEQRLFVLRTEGDSVCISRFNQPIVGKSYTLLRRKRKSDEVDSDFPIFRIKVDQVYSYVVSGVYENPRLPKKLSVGDGVKIID